MKNKIIIVLLSVVFIFVISFLFKMTSSYFVDDEVTHNIITIGEISVKLDENFKVPDNVLSGREFTKAPKLTNNGTKDEFVFLGVTLPRENITPLYDEDTVINVYDENNNITGTVTKKKGEKIKDKGLYEIFKFIAETNTAQSLTETKLPNTCYNTPTQTVDYDVNFGYHAGTFKQDNTPDKTGWVLVKCFTETKSVYEKDIITDTYIFGYNKKLQPDESTLTLFDKVRLKDCLNGELKSEKSIFIQPYAIQAEKLRATGLTANYSNAVTLSDLGIIFNVIEREAGTP